MGGARTERRRCRMASAAPASACPLCSRHRSGRVASATSNKRSAALTEARVWLGALIDVVVGRPIDGAISAAVARQPDKAQRRAIPNESCMSPKLYVEPLSVQPNQCTRSNMGLLQMT